jgi:toll-interacting protein
MASAVASSNYTASVVAASGASSNYATATTFQDNKAPKFLEYRSRVMLGDLPQDFLRVQFLPAQVHDPAAYGMRQGYAPMPQQLHQNPNFLGYFTLTIAEAKLVKNSGILGIIKMDPYVSFRIGHVAYETPIATGGGKNPQWKASYRINLFKGMDRIHLEVYDQRNFTEDSFIGECEIIIPREVMEGETRQHWYPLMGRQANASENQGDILVIMSFTSTRATNQPSAASSTSTPVANPNGNANSSTDANASSLPFQSTNITEQQQPVPQHSPSAIPKPPPPPYSPEDVQTIEEMFPSIDRRIITELLDKHGGNKDLVVNHLLQNIA